jgi:pyruvate dehydrogenase (quinone)/pyruvate oxidase
MLGKECVPDDSPYTTGGIGLVGTLPSEIALEECDALLIVGSTMPYIEFYPQPGQASVIQIDDKPERIGLRALVHLGLVGDAKPRCASCYHTYRVTLTVPSSSRRRTVCGSGGR